MRMSKNGKPVLIKHGQLLSGVCIILAVKMDIHVYNQ